MPRAAAVAAIALVLVLAGCGDEEGTEGVSIDLRDDQVEEVTTTTRQAASEEDDPEEIATTTEARTTTAEAVNEGWKYAGSPEGLAAFLSDARAAILDVDTETLAELQGDYCSDTPEEIGVAMSEADALIRSFYGYSLREWFMAFEYVIVDFDENALTGTATTETVTDDPDLRLILAGSEEELTVYEHRSGMWHTNDECWSDANS